MLVSIGCAWMRAQIIHGDKFYGFRLWKDPKWALTSVSLLVTRAAVACVDNAIDVIGRVGSLKLSPESAVHTAFSGVSRD